MRPQGDPPFGHRTRWWSGRGWWLALAAVTLVALVRVRLLEIPLERDEGEYAYVGQLMLEGVPPYQLAYNMKLPGTYAAYAAIMTLFGQTPAAIHFGLTIVTSLTALLLYGLGRRLLDETAGVVAASSYALLAAGPNLLGLAGHATHFAALFVTAGACLLWPARAAPRWRAAASAGLMFGTATLMKQHAAVFGVFGLACLGMALAREKALTSGTRARALAAFGAGSVLPFALTSLALWRAGVFERFWFWTVTYAREYVSQVPLRQAPGVFRSAFLEVISRGGLVWALAGLGLGLVWCDARLRRTRWELTVFFLAAILAVCPGFLFRTHYFLVALPAVALVAGCAVSVARRWRREDAAEARHWPVWAFVLIAAATVFENREIWFVQGPVQASKTIYAQNPFPEAESVARLIRGSSRPDARVAVLGSEPEVFFLSHRRSATGYIYVYPLMEAQPFAARMQQEMVSELERARPEFVLVVLAATSWLATPDSPRLLADWWSLRQSSYTLVAAVDTAGTSETRRLSTAGVAVPTTTSARGLLLYLRHGAADR